MGGKGGQTACTPDSLGTWPSVCQKPPPHTHLTLMTHITPLTSHAPYTTTPHTIHNSQSRGPRSALAILRPGLALSELAVSPLPGAPTAVFTLKAHPDDEQDGFIVVSFSNATLVFEIGEEVKETSSSGFLATVATLHTQLLEDGSMLQVKGYVCACVVFFRGWGRGRGACRLAAKHVAWLWVTVLLLQRMGSGMSNTHLPTCLTHNRNPALTPQLQSPILSDPLPTPPHPPPTHSFKQIHSGGLRHIRTDRRINEWRAPGRRSITRATSNSRQVVIALSGEA